MHFVLFISYSSQKKSHFIKNMLLNCFILHFLLFFNFLFLYFLASLFSTDSSIHSNNYQQSIFCNKQQINMKTTHFTNSNHEAVVLLCLIQLLMIAFFFTFKDKDFTSLHSISCKSIQTTVNLFIDYVSCCFLSYLLSHVSTCLP